MGNVCVVQLMQEIEDHHGHINSLCFGDDGDKMYSADSVGALCIWNVFVTDQTSRRGKNKKIRDMNCFPFCKYSSF